MYDQNGTVVTSHSNTTVYDVGSADTLSYILHFNDTIYNQNLAGSLPLSNTTNYTITYTNYGNGTWLINVNPLTIGTSTLTLVFSMQYYASYSVTLTFDVSANTLTIKDQSNANWQNKTVTTYYNKDGLGNYTNSFTITSTTYGTLMNTGFTLVANATNSADTTILFNNVTTGTWTLYIDPNQVGTFVFIFNFVRYGYVSQQIILTITVNTTPTTVKDQKGKIATSHSNTTVKELGSAETLTYIIHLNDTI